MRRTLEHCTSCMSPCKKERQICSSPSNKSGKELASLMYRAWVMGMMRRRDGSAARESGAGPRQALSTPGPSLGHQQPAWCSPKNEEAKRPDLVLDSLHIYVSTCWSSCF
ncbi:hypothetical protein J6590_059789 [Homalodisca vitripennis]|nr:hypothetical protein J6590_059789 [Homalodisca vitripennis]